MKQPDRTDVPSGMSPRTPRQYEAIRARRRKAIIAAALRLFATRGVETTSMEQIARRARISKGLIYNHFPSKKALLKAVAMRGVEELMASFPPNLEEMSPRQVLEELINNSFEAVRRRREFWALYINLFTEPLLVPRYRSFFMGEAEKFRSFVASRLEQAGMPAPDAEAALLLAVLDGVFLGVLIAGDAYPLESVRKLVLQRYVYG